MPTVRLRKPRARHDRRTCGTASCRWNFGGSTSIGIGRVRDLDYDNGDNGTYLIGGDWEILGREFFGEPGTIDDDRRKRIEDEVVHKTEVLTGAKQ